MHPDIVRMERQQEFGLIHWHILGLNLFAYNNVAGPIEQRPDVLFLRDITTRLPCSAHVSAMALKDRVDTPEEIFGPSEGATPYLRTRIDYYDGFYDLEASPVFDACFFPRVTPLFWQALLKEEGDLEQMLLNHGLVFYIAPHPNTMAEMQRLLNAPFPGVSPWLNAVASLYELVLMVGHDGQYLHTYAREAANIRLIETSLTTVLSAVEASEWFQTHKEVLVWSEHWDACLMLPKQIGAES